MPRTTAVGKEGVQSIPGANGILGSWHIKPIIKQPISRQQDQVCLQTATLIHSCLARK